MSLEIYKEEPTNKLSELTQWIADNERLVLAGFLNSGPGPLDFDEESVDAVRLRCIKRLGEIAGTLYFQGLIATFPDRHKELFPEEMFEEIVK